MGYDLVKEKAVKELLHSKDKSYSNKSKETINNKVESLILDAIERSELEKTRTVMDRHY